MSHVPLNDHTRAKGPDTSLDEPMGSDDEFLPMVEKGEGTFTLDHDPTYPGHKHDRRRKVRRS